MTGRNKVRTALVTASKTFLTASSSIDTSDGEITGLPTMASGKVSWENRKFSIPSNDVYASVFYVPNNPEAATIGSGGQDILTGFLQIDIDIPSGKGEKEMMSWERKAELYFPAGRSFSEDGQNVIVTSSGFSQGRQNGDTWRK